MPHLTRIPLPEPEAGTVSKLQEHLQDLAKYARTFTAAAEMLSFSQQRAAAHEAQFTGDSSVLAMERRSLLSEWQNIAVREGAMTLFHFAEGMNSIAIRLGECPTLSASIDHAGLLGVQKRFKLAFPGFKAIENEADAPAPLLPVPEQPRQISFSQSYSSEHVRLHGAKNNVFKFGQSMKYIATTAGSANHVSYALDSKSVYELREIATVYGQIFSDAADRLSPNLSA